MGELEFDSSNVTVVFDARIGSRRDEVDGIVEGLMQVIRALPCAREHLDEVHLALSEALANAVIHGNRDDPTKQVHIRAGCANGEQLLLAITDQGPGFDFSAIPDPTTAENIFSTHGRGIFLMNRLMDQAEYRLGGRQVVLRKRVSGRM